MSQDTGNEQATAILQIHGKKSVSNKDKATRSFI
jgi:hypothetical protein